MPMKLPSIFVPQKTLSGNSCQKRSGLAKMVFFFSWKNGNQISHVERQQTYLIRSDKLTQQWKVDLLNMYFLSNMGKFYCYLGVLEGTWLKKKNESGKVDDGRSNAPWI